MALFPTRVVKWREQAWKIEAEASKTLSRPVVFLSQVNPPRR
jgi:hypothetical protein